MKPRLRLQLQLEVALDNGTKAGVGGWSSQWSWGRSWGSRRPKRNEPAAPLPSLRSKSLALDFAWNRKRPDSNAMAPTLGVYRERAGGQRIHCRTKPVRVLLFCIISGPARKQATTLWDAPTAESIGTLKNFQISKITLKSKLITLKNQPDHPQKPRITIKNFPITFKSYPINLKNQSFR